MAQLQEHPHEVSIGFREVLYLQQQYACIEIPRFSLFAAFCVVRLPQFFLLFLDSIQAAIACPLASQILALHLFLKAVDEVLVRRGDYGGAAEKHLLKGVGELSVELDEVSYLGFVLLVKALVKDGLWGDDAGALDALVVVKILLLELRERVFGYPGLAVGVSIDEKRQEVSLPDLCIHLLPFLLLFPILGLLLDDLVLMSDDGLVDGVHVELRFLFVAEALLPGQVLLPHEAARQLLLDLHRSHLVEESLVAEPPRWRKFMNVHAFRDFLQLLAQVHRLEVAVAEYELVELLLVDRPHLLEPSLEVPLEHRRDVAAPGVVALLAAEGLQQLVQHRF